MEIHASDADCLGGEAVYLNGRHVGTVSSGGYGHRVKKSLAFAYVSPEVSHAGARLEVLIMGERRPAEVLAEPVYDPSNKKPRTIG
jgi:dimethylglycine dehydrogenase